jgi:RASD family, member 2
VEITEAISKYDWECGYMECSAKENRNIVQVFKELLAQAKVNTKISYKIYDFIVNVEN